VSSGSVERTVRILAVVVLYRQQATESRTLQALLPQRQRTAGLELAIVLFDNGPHPAAPASLPPGIEYHAATHNEGLAGAYNYGLAVALAKEYDWLLTLDQDTDLPPHYLQAMREAAERLDQALEVAAIVPHLVDEGTPVSPVRVRFARITSLPTSFEGIPAGEVRAFNSGALLRVSALQELGGFDERFWLSFLDGWLYRQFHTRGKKVYVLGNVLSEHKLSLLNYRERLSLAHFRNFLAAESAFHDLYCGLLEGALYTARLGGRLINQRRRKEAAEIRQTTLTHLLQRLTWSRKRRLAEWHLTLGGKAR
jgi:GT2 family glycosyltransferase